MCAYDYRSEDKATLKFNLIGQYSILTLQKEKSFLWKNKSDCKASQTCCASEVSSMHLQTLNQYKQQSQDAIISGHFLFIPNYPWEENGEVSLQYYNTSHQSVGRGKWSWIRTFVQIYYSCLCVVKLCSHFAVLFFILEQASPWISHSLITTSVSEYFRYSEMSM